MAVSYYEDAQALRVVDVWQPGNETGWVTPRGLYDPRVKIDGEVRAPSKARTIGWIDHGTVGTNTLRFWGTSGSVNNGTFSLAKYLIPHDTTEYADKRAHDTRNTVFKMIPDWAACNHTGPAIEPWGNHNTIGMEYESLQNGRHDIGDRQYINGALVFAYEAALNGIRDAWRLPHGIIALEWGRRSDPWAGLFDIARSWEIVQAVRRDSRIWQMWGLPQPAQGL